MALQIEVLREMVDWAEKQAKLPLKKKKWRQAVWAQRLSKDLFHPEARRVATQRSEVACGTVMCLAGHVVINSGKRYRLINDDVYNGYLTLRSWQKSEHRDWGTEALKLLGLVTREGRSLPGADIMRDLFNNDRAGIRQVRKAARETAALWGYTL